MTEHQKEKPTVCVPLKLGDNVASSADTRLTVREAERIYRTCPRCGERIVRRRWTGHRFFSLLGDIYDTIWGFTLMCKSCGWWEIRASGRCPICGDSSGTFPWDCHWIYEGDGSVFGPWGCPNCGGTIELEPAKLDDDFYLAISPQKAVGSVVITHGWEYDHARRRPLRKPTEEEFRQEEDWRKNHAIPLSISEKPAKPAGGVCR